MKENTRFFIKVIFAHVLTYTLCGMIFMNLFNYEPFFEQEGWRSLDSIIVGLAPVFQIIRGILYAIVFLFIKDTIYSKYGVLKLYVLMVIIGIFNIPEPVSNSIEGLIYRIPTEPFNVLIGGTLEILTQNLLFCIIVCTKWDELFAKIRNKKNE